MLGRWWVQGPGLAQSSARGQGRVYDRLRFICDAAQMLLAAKALHIDLVNILRAGWTRCEPSILGDHLQTADGSAIAGRMAKYAQDLFAGQFLA